MVKGAKWISDDLFVLALPYPDITEGAFIYDVNGRSSARGKHIFKCNELASSNSKDLKGLIILPAAGGVLADFWLPNEIDSLNFQHMLLF